jgi:imidazolonepropionase-like amidohydrolase
MSFSGTDAMPQLPGLIPGLSVHQELSLYVDKCGLSATEALRTATSVSARRFRLEDRGVIAPGKRADLILTKGNPTQEIGDTLSIEGIWRRGVKVNRTGTT